MAKQVIDTATGTKAVKDRIDLLTGVSREAFPAFATGLAIRMRREQPLPCVDKIKATATPPEACSPAIPVAPALGLLLTYRHAEVVMTPSGSRVRRDPMPGGLAARVASPLDLLERASRRRDAGPLFTNGQHAAAAAYEALFQRVNSGRVKCSSFGDGGGGGGDGVMDAVVHDIGRLRRMDAAIGTGAVLEPRGPSAMPGRTSIRAAVLIQWALIRQQPLSELLARHGWGLQTKHRERLREGLTAALDGLHGL